jgi:hypothetical protein
MSIQSYWGPRWSHDSFVSKVGDYNKHVQNKFKLDYDDNAFSIFLINTPSMFELTFLPYLMGQIADRVDAIDRLSDPIDECMNHVFDEIKQVLVLICDPQMVILRLILYSKRPWPRRALKSTRYRTTS